ncbi:MAG: sensor histidine kinase [Opitutae bacterium]|nr:sensor histidine kinase [Opitutae bacterium]
MPVSVEPIAPAAPRSRAVAWWLARFPRDRPPPRGLALAVVAGAVAGIGWADYLTGPQISFAPFYLAPIALSLVWLGWPAAVGTAAGSVVVQILGNLATGGSTAGGLTASWNRLVELSFYLIVIRILHALVQLHRRLEQRVRERTAALEHAIAARDELQTKLFEVSRRERGAIGHELHDGLGQHLTALSFAANHLAGKLSATAHPAAADALHLVSMTQAGIAQTRQIARGLLLAAVEPAELLPKLEELAGALQAEHGPACRFEHSGDPARCLDGARSAHLFYIAQEAALNALRHGRPTAVTIRLQATAAGLELIVTDNGRGLPPAPAPGSGMGLRIMAHRAELLGGTFRVEPAPGAGVQIRCRLPLRHPAETTHPSP